MEAEKSKPFPVETMGLIIACLGVLIYAIIHSSSSKKKNDDTFISVNDTSSPSVRKTMFN